MKGVNVLQRSRTERFALVLLTLPLFLLLNAGSCPPPAPTPPFDCGSPITESAEVVEASDPVAGCYNVLATRLPENAALSADGYRAYVEGLAEGYSFTDYAVFPLIDGFEVRMTETQAQEMAANPDLTVFECESVSIDAVSSWGLDRIDQRDLPLDGLYEVEETGAGVHVTINDTGEPFALGDFNAGECYSAVGGSCKDDHDHGSHVGGTVGHREFGVAPGATLHWCKSLINGNGADADVIECVDWFAALCQENGWRCLGNMSLGGDPSEVFDRALCASIDAGVGWAVAAGNSDEDACLTSPSRVRQAMTAGATASDDDRAGFSNTGVCVDLFAPGLDIPSIGANGVRLVLSGTSMASPHVAGVMALCAERLGTSDPEALERCVLESATEGRVDDVGTDSPNLLLYARPD